MAVGDFSRVTADSRAGLIILINIFFNIAFLTLRAVSY